MSANVNDVARLAGVSPRTVSNVVNDFVHVRPETREKVLRAIEQLNYRPNVAARRLRQGRTNMLGYIVPELSQPYFAELSELIEAEARTHGYTVIARQTSGHKDAEEASLKDFTSHMVDGLIFSPMAMQKEDLYETPPQVPAVLIGEQISSTKYTSVAIDNIQAAKDITAHLIASGRRKIVTLGAYHSDLYRPSRLRLQGFKEALEEADIAFADHMVLYTDEFGRAAGRSGVIRALEEGIEFDAIVCFTDLLAFGAIRALADHGLRVPEDVAIIAIDDISESEYSVPSLTTVRPNKEEIARQAVTTLIRTINQETPDASDVLIDYALVVRESTASPKD